MQILSFVADNERQYIRQRQAEGIAAAKKRGVKFGRPAVQPSPAFPAIYARWRTGELSAARVAKLLSVDPKTFLK